MLRKSVDANFLLGYFEQAEVLLERAFTLLDRHADGGDADLVVTERAVFQTRQSAILRERGRLRDALQLAKRAFAVLALTDHHTEVARLQIGMGICYARLGRLEKAEELFNDGLATFRRIDSDLGVANLLNNLAVLHKMGCRWDRALSLMEKAVALAERIGASHLLPGFYLNRGIVLAKVDRLGEARTLLAKGLRLAASLGDRVHQTRLNLAMGRLETLSGRLARAEELILEGRALAEEGRYLREATIADEYLGDILLARGDVEKARYNYELGLQKSRRIASGNDLEAELQRRMGEAHLAAGRTEDAIAVSQAAIAICQECGEAYELGFCHATLGRAYADQGDTRLSDHHFREAIATFSQQQLTHHWCRTILAFADARREGAGEAELLLLRRYLMDAQENGAATVGDRMLCDILDRLARVQIRLAQFDDALLTVFELERHAAGLEDDVLARNVVALRDRIEAGLLGGVQTAENHLHTISDLPGLFSRHDDSVPRNLDSVLAGGMDKVQADSGFIAMADGREAGLCIVARAGLTDNLAQQLTRWFDHEMAEGRRPGHGLLLPYRRRGRPGAGGARRGHGGAQLRLHAHQPARPALRPALPGAGRCGRRHGLRPRQPGLPGHLHGLPGPVPLREGAGRPARRGHAHRAGGELREHHHPQQPHAGRAGPGPQGGAQRPDGAAQRRDRHRQGPAGLFDPRLEPALGAALPVHQLRRHSRDPCWRASCSATSGAASPGPTATSGGCWPRPRAGRSSWTRSARCPWACRASCCTSWTPRWCGRWAPTPSSRWTSASSAPPRTTCTPWPWKACSWRTSTTACWTSP